MTKEEFENNKRKLKPLNAILNFTLFIDMLVGIASIVWLIWGGGSPAWKLLTTTLVLFFFIMFLYRITCYPYYEDDAEKNKVDEFHYNGNRRPFNNQNNPTLTNEYGEPIERPINENNNIIRFN